MTDTEQDGAPAPTEEQRPLLGPVVKRRRRSSVPDPVLAEAAQTAREGVLEITDAATIGSAHRMRVEEDRLLTHLFECLLPGYRGWFWYSTVARAPRSKAVTVCEVGLLPGDDALLAPDWVPWADRVRPEELGDEHSDEAGEDASGASEGEAEPAASEGSGPEAAEQPAGETAPDAPASGAPGRSRRTGQDAPESEERPEDPGLESGSAEDGVAETAAEEQPSSTGRTGDGALFEQGVERD